MTICSESCCKKPQIWSNFEFMGYYTFTPSPIRGKIWHATVNPRHALARQTRSPWWCILVSLRVEKPQIWPRVEIQHSVLAPPSGDYQKFNARAQLQTLLNFDSLIATPFSQTLSFKSIRDKNVEHFGPQFKPRHTCHAYRGASCHFWTSLTFSNLINSFAARDRWNF